MNATEIVKRFEIPKTTFYRLVKQGHIPAHEQPRKPWHQRRYYLFNPDEVAAALEALKPK